MGTDIEPISIELLPPEFKSCLAKIYLSKSPSIIGNRLLPKPTYSSVNLTKPIKKGINKDTSKIFLMNLIFERKSIVSTILNINRTAMWGRTRAMIKTEVITI